MAKRPGIKKEADEARWLHRNRAAILADAEAWMPAREAFPNLRPSSERVNIRIPSALLAEIRREAAKRDMPYQSLMKFALYDAFMPEVAKRPGRKADRVVRRKRRVG